MKAFLLIVAFSLVFAQSFTTASAQGGQPPASQTDDMGAAGDRYDAPTNTDEQGNSDSIPANLPPKSSTSQAKIKQEKDNEPISTSTDEGDEDSIAAYQKTSRDQSTAKPASKAKLSKKRHHVKKAAGGSQQKPEVTNAEPDNGGWFFLIVLFLGVISSPWWFPLITAYLEKNAAAPKPKSSEADPVLPDTDYSRFKL